MSAEEIKALERRFIKEWNKGKAATMAVIDELCATNIIYHGGDGEEIRGLKDFKQSMGEFYSAFPDSHFTIDDMVAEGDKVVVRWTMTGTHKGEFGGISPTNKKVTIWGIYIDRIAGGKAVETWERFDTLGLMQQLGPVPPPGKRR
jgi:predicted ester cyclase